MQSPKNSSKHSLVTYGSDVSDEEIESINNIPLPKREQSNDPSDLRSMDISPITNDSKSVYSNEPTPIEKTNTDFPAVVPLKKRRTTDNILGLVSYAMDENDDDFFESADDKDQEQYSSDDSQANNNYKDLSNEYSDNANTSHNNVNIDGISGIDNEECFNAEDRESDIENQDAMDVNHKGERHRENVIDLKTMSGQSSSKVKATVLTNRPKGTELAYLLSRQIHNNRHAEIQLQNLPTVKPPPEHELRINELRAKSKNSPWNMTQAILNHKEYRNPSIYEKLIEHMKIDERGTNYPPELYDPYRFTKESYYEELAKAQDEAERKRLQQVKNGAPPPTCKPTNTTLSHGPGQVKRKTKWDLGSNNNNNNK